MTATPCLAASEDELAAAIALGDRDAFAELYDRIAPPLFGLVKDRVSDGRLAESIVLEAFLELWKQAPRLNGSPVSVSSWLLRAVNRRDRATIAIKPE